MLDVVLHFHNEAVRELGIAGSTIDERGSRSQVLKLRHLLVEAQSVLGGVFFVQRQAHGDAHPEVLRNLEGVTVSTFNAVTVVQRHDSDVLEQFVTAWLQGGCEKVKVEHLNKALVDEALFYAATDVLFEVLGVQLFELCGRVVISENALVNGLHEEA